MYPDGICYGNVSLRHQNDNSFYITASDTGKINKLIPAHYVWVKTCRTDINLCTYAGSGLPSSESLSHYVIYENRPRVNAVIHIHNKKLWDKLLNKIPTTNPKATYGSIAMTKAIVDVLKNDCLKQSDIFVMGGHEEGLICFGNTMAEALNILQTYAEAAL